MHHCTILPHLRAQWGAVTHRWTQPQHQMHFCTTLLILVLEIRFNFQIDVQCAENMLSAHYDLHLQFYDCWYVLYFQVCTSRAMTSPSTHRWWSWRLDVCHASSLMRVFNTGEGWASQMRSLSAGSSGKVIVTFQGQNISNTPDWWLSTSLQWIQFASTLVTAVLP